MMDIRFFSLIILILMFVGMDAQTPLAIGEWRSHSSYTTGQYVTQTPDEVWVASDISIIIFDKEENSTSFLERTDGLSDVEVRTLEYHAPLNLMVAIYSNSNIDLIDVATREIVNLDDIKRRTDLGDKTIYDVHFEGNDAFLSCGFGIVKMSLERLEMEYTTFTGVRMNALTAYEGDLYASSLDGIYKVSQTAVNLADWSSWELLDEDDGMPEAYHSYQVHVHNDELYVDVNDTLFIYDGLFLDYVYHKEDYGINYLVEGTDKLIVGTLKRPYFGQEIRLLRDDGTVFDIAFFSLAGFGRNAIEDEVGNIWVGEDGRQVKHFNPNTFVWERFDFNSPYSINTGHLEFKDGALWSSPGAITVDWQPLFLLDGFSKYENGSWTNYPAYSVSGLESLDVHGEVFFDRISGKLFIASFKYGLVEFDPLSETGILYNADNSALVVPAGDETTTRIVGFAQDDENRIWMSHHGTGTPIVARLEDGTLKTFPVSSVTNLAFATIDQVGNKWFTTQGQGLLVFNEGDDFENHADNLVRVISSSNSQLPSNNVNTIVTDQDGDVWVGTSQGVVIFECGGNAFEVAQCQGTRRVVVREDGINAYLLESENIRDIVVDGGNRKWVATDNGIYHLSEDGLTELRRFTKENSPLISDAVKSIAINPDNGEVFFATSKGIMAYKGDAVEGLPVHSINAYVYPNPVRPDYEGPIAIKGLPTNATVRITDINGTLVFETQANGGQAIWDGKDYNGREANSGVYLVFSVNEANLNNPNGRVAKILKLK